MMKKKPLLFIDYINGFGKQICKTALLVTVEQAKFIRSYRLKKMKRNSLNT
jgi:hypothetical protein